MGIPIRRRRRYGTLAVDRAEWISKQNWYDLAIADITVDEKIHKIFKISTEMISSLDDLQAGGVGAGSDVFMIGRYVDHDGGATNQPTVRSGHISAMPQVIARKVGGDGMPSYLLDMHSRSGYSGSPVFVYQPNTKLKGGTLSMVGGPGFLKLLGVHARQFPEMLEIHTKKPKEKSLQANKRRKVTVPEPAKQYIKAWSGMTLAVPASAIMELLDMPNLKEPRDKALGEYRETAANAPVPEFSEPPTTDENPLHREDFNSLLDAAVQPPPTDD